MRTYEERDDQRRLTLATLGAGAAAALIFAPGLARNAARGLGKLSDRYIKNFVVKDQKRNFFSGEGSRFSSFTHQVKEAIHHSQFKHNLREILTSHTDENIRNNSELILDKMLYSDFTYNVMSGYRNPYDNLSGKFQADPKVAMMELHAFRDLRKTLVPTQSRQLDRAQQGALEAQAQILSNAVREARERTSIPRMDRIHDDVMLQYGRTLVKRANSRQSKVARAIGKHFGMAQESLGDFFARERSLEESQRSPHFGEHGFGTMMMRVVEQVRAKDGDEAADAILNNIRASSVYRVGEHSIDLSNVRPMYSHMTEWLKHNVTIPFSPLFGSFTPFRLFPWMKSAKQDFVLYHSHYKGLAMNQMLGRALGQDIGRDVAVIGGKAFGLPNADGELEDLGISGKNINLNSSSMQQVFYNLAGLKRTKDGEDFTTGFLHSHLDKDTILGRAARFLKLGSQDKETWAQEKLSIYTKYGDPSHPTNVFGRLTGGEMSGADMVSDISRMAGWVTSNTEVDTEYALTKLLQSDEKNKLSPLLVEALQAFATNERYLAAARTQGTHAGAQQGSDMGNYLFDSTEGLLKRIANAVQGGQLSSDVVGVNEVAIRLNSVRAAAMGVLQNPEIDTGMQATLPHTLFSEIREASSGVRPNITRLDQFRMELLAEAGQQLTQAGSSLDTVFSANEGQDQAARLFGWSKGVQSLMEDQTTIAGEDLPGIGYATAANRARLFKDQIRGNLSMDIMDLLSQKAGNFNTWNPLSDPQTAPYMFVQDYKQKGPLSVIERVKGYFSSNTQDLRPDSLGAYFMASKLNEMLDAYGLGLPQEMMKSTNATYTNLFKYRVLPVLAGVEAYKHGGWMLHKLGLNVPDMISKPLISAQLAATRVEDMLGITRIKKDLVNSIPGLDTAFTPRNADELEYHYDYGFDTVRRGRFWLMASKSPFMGESIEGYVPTWNRQASSYWQSAKNVEMQGFQSLIHSPLLNPIGAVLDKDWWQRRHIKDRPYPMGKSMITPHNSMLTLPSLIDPIQDTVNLRGLPTHGEAFRALALHTMGSQDLAPLAEKQIFVDADYDIGMGYPGEETGYLGRVEQSGTMPYVGGAQGFGSRAMMGNLAPGNLSLNLPHKAYKKGAGRKQSPGYGYVMGGGGFLGALGNILGYGGTPHEGGTYNLNTGRKGYREQMQKINEASAAGLPMGESQLQSFEITNPRSLRSGIARSVAAQNELYGLYGWMRDAAAENLPIPGSDNPKISYDTPDWAISTSRQFWEKRLGGLDPIPILGELNELTRRVLTRRSSSDIRFNPIPNNMPAWIPGDDAGGVNYRIGDPYTKTMQGEMRLPGEAYRLLNPKRFEKPLLSMRASMLGHDKDELLRYYFGEKALEGDVGGYASAKGTQLHKQIQSAFKASGLLEQEEVYVYDKKHDISGHMDMLLKDMQGNQVIGEIKTMGEAKFRSGKVFKPGVSQLQQYMYTTGIHRGFLLYVNQQNPAEMREIPVQYNRLSLAMDHARLAGVRAKLNKQMANGNLNEGTFYPDLVKFEILSDIAAFSPQWENLKTVIEQDEQLSPADHYRFKEALKMAHEKRKRFNLYPYRYGSEEEHSGVVESISKEGLIYLEGERSPVKMAGVELILEKVNSGQGNMLESMREALGLGDGKTPEQKWIGRKLKHISWHMLGLNLAMADGQKGTKALMSEYGITEGRKVSYKTNAIFDDSGKPVSAIVSSLGHPNVGKSLLTRGFARVDETDDSPEAWKTRNDRLPGILANPLEHLAHTDNIINNKLLHTRTALEEWKRSHIFGTSSSSWEHPFRSFVYPTFTALGNKDPLSAFAQGGIFTSLFMKEGDMLGKAKQILTLGKQALSATRENLNKPFTSGDVSVRVAAYNEYQNLRDSAGRSIAGGVRNLSRHMNNFAAPLVTDAVDGAREALGNVAKAIPHAYNSLAYRVLGEGAKAAESWQKTKDALNQDYSSLTAPLKSLGIKALRDTGGLFWNGLDQAKGIGAGLAKAGLDALDSRFGDKLGFAKRPIDAMRNALGDAELPQLGNLKEIGAALGSNASKRLLDAIKDVKKNKKYAAFLYGGVAMAGVSVGSHILHPTEAGRIPLRAKRRWAIDEYYDALKYVKYRGMYLKAAQQAKDEEGINIDEVATTLERRRAKDQNDANETILAARRHAARIRHGLFEDPGHVLGAHLRPLVDGAIKSIDEVAAGAQNTIFRKPANFMSNLMHNMFATYEERQAMKQQNADNVMNAAEAKVKRLQNNTNYLLDLGPTAQRALYARHKYQETAYGTDPGNLQQALGTVSSNVRQIYSDVVSTGSPREKKEFYSLLPGYQKRLFQPYLSPKSHAPSRPTLSHIFHKYQLPDADWKGWGPGVDIELLKARTYEAEGLDAIDAGVYPVEVKKAKVITRGIELPIVRTNTVGSIDAKLRAIAGGEGAERYDTRTSLVSSYSGTSRLSINMQQDMGGQINSMVNAIDF